MTILGGVITLEGMGGSVEEWIMSVMSEDVDRIWQVKELVDELEDYVDYSRGEIVSGLFQLEYEGRIYQVFPDEWRVTPK